MRPLGLLLCLTACKLDNPAFMVTEGTGTPGPTTDAATDPTRPTTGPAGPTTTNNNTEPGTSDSTGAGDPTGTSDVVTTSPVSDTEGTTDPPATSTSTSDGTTTDSQPMTTTTTDPNSSDTGPMMCVAFDDPLGPLVQLQAHPDNKMMGTDQCVEWENIEWRGRLAVDNLGFTVVNDPLCPPAVLPVPGFRFPVPLATLPEAKGVCVTLRFTIHADHPKCMVSGVFVEHEDKPVLWGSFGRSAFPDEPLPVGFTPTSQCGCDDCCAPAPAPDLYVFEVANEKVAEGTATPFEMNGENHQFRNLRSHIHAPECQDGSLATADWLHFDWVAVQIP